MFRSPSSSEGPPAWGSVLDSRLALAILALALLWPAMARGAGGVAVLTVNGAIGPAVADYVVRGIAHAAERGDQLVVLKMDTPGGLDTSMRDIIKAILTSSVPVAVYVAPSGARAASAGTYLLYASHVAAMAPGTNVGAATPIAIGLAPQRPPPERERGPDRRGEQGKRRRADEGTGPDQEEPSSAMTRKQVNDAAAYLRGLAQMRGRNADWAELAVREAVSLTAEDALKQNVIEYIAPDVPALLSQLDRKTVAVMGQERRLETKGAAIAGLEPDWRTKLLAVIANPSVALILMTLGVYGLVFEFMSPGFGVPGVVGAICLLLGLYSLQLLPLNYAGLGLILLGLLFMVAEAFAPSFGVLGLGGVVAFVTGAVILIDTELPGFGIPPVLIGTLGLASALLLVGTVRLALVTRKRAVVSGTAGMPGTVAQVERLADANAHEAWIRVEGELWKAVSPLPLKPAQSVKILRRRGLILDVVPVDTPEGA